MDVIWHYDVADDLKDVFGSSLFGDFEETVPGFWSAEDWAFSDATEGYEVEVSSLVVAL